MQYKQEQKKQEEEKPWNIIDSIEYVKPAQRNTIL